MGSLTRKRRGMDDAPGGHTFAVLTSLGFCSDWLVFGPATGSGQAIVQQSLGADRSGSDGFVYQERC
jgi:hypothetical protein